MVAPHHNLAKHERDTSMRQLGPARRPTQEEYDTDDSISPGRDWCSDHEVLCGHTHDPFRSVIGVEDK